MKRILFYTNQFFGQIGGEEFAYTKPFVEDGKRGNANAFGVPVGFLPLAHRLRASSPVDSTTRGSRSASPPSISHVRLLPVSFSFLAPFLPAWIHFSRGVSPDSAVRVFGAPRG